MFKEEEEEEKEKRAEEEEEEERGVWTAEDSLKSPPAPVLPGVELSVGVRP